MSAATAGRLGEPEAQDFVSFSHCRAGTTVPPPVCTQFSTPRPLAKINLKNRERKERGKSLYPQEQVHGLSFSLRLTLQPLAVGQGRAHFLGESGRGLRPQPLQGQTAWTVGSAPRGS